MRNSTSSNNPSNTLSKISKDLTTKKNKKDCAETPNTTSVIKKSQKISQEIVMRKIKSQGKDIYMVVVPSSNNINSPNNLQGSGSTTTNLNNQGSNDASNLQILQNLMTCGKLSDKRVLFNLPDE